MYNRRLILKIICWHMPATLFLFFVSVWVSI
nr:MAG TPA_asm: hypothetical protein [Caudoviricetes sp.]